MKARPLKNLLEHNQNLFDKYGDEFSDRKRSQTSGWIHCIRYILENYDCKAKEIRK